MYTFIYACMQTYITYTSASIQAICIDAVLHTYMHIYKYTDGCVPTYIHANNHA